jgi:hypothetical protein
MLVQMQRRNSSSKAALTPDAAEFLTNPATGRFLQPFVGRECSVATAAKELNLAVNALLYRVKQMQGLGLLDCVREERRSGRPIKYYRTTEDRYFVPFDMVRAETVESLLLDVDRYMLAQFYQGLAGAFMTALQDGGIAIWRNDDDIVYWRIADASGRVIDREALSETPIVPTFWSNELWLNREDSVAFLGEIFALISRYHGRGGPTRNAFHFGFGPLILG